MQALLNLLHINATIYRRSNTILVEILTYLGNGFAFLGDAAHAILHAMGVEREMPKFAKMLSD